MNVTTAKKNRFKQIFSDYEMEENKEKKASLKKEYVSVRTFCLDCEIFTFSELEVFEYGCLTRINKLQTQK